MTYNIQTDNLTAAIAQLVTQFNAENKRSIGRFEANGIDKATGDKFKLVITLKKAKEPKLPKGQPDPCALGHE